MSSVNKAILIGRAGRDPEIRRTTENMVIASLSLATSYKTKAEEITDWHRVQLFGRLAEIVEQYVRKGSLLYIEGKIKTRKYTDKSGADKYVTEIIADNMQMLGSRDEQSQGDGTQSTPKQQYGQPQQSYGQPKPQAQDIGDMDSDIPF